MEKRHFEGRGTGELVDELMARGLDPFGLELVNEIAARKDAVPFIRRQLQYHSEDGWTAIHAIHLLGMIRTRESFDALCFALINRQEALSDWLTESMPGLLAGFGPECLPDLERIFALEFLDEYVRSVASGAISAIGWRHPEARERAVSFLKGVIEKEKNSYLVADAICELCDMREAGPAIQLIGKAFDDGRVDEDVIGRENALEEAMGEDPRITPDDTFERCEGYFTQKNFDYLRGTNAGQEKGRQEVAKNALCPCGSGKRYKKCCMGKDSGSTEG